MKKMENFVWNMPTRLHFGRGVCDKIRNFAPSYGKKALLVIGSGSVKQNGILKKISDELEAAEIDFEIFEGIRSNPGIEEVRAAREICRQKNIEFIVAVGGGSVIDSCKAIACSTLHENDPWDLFTQKLRPTRALPLMTVLTLAATGTEMNAFAVVQNETAGTKTSFGSPLAIPRDSFLDPAFTISVPRDYTAYGLADIVAHSLEVYFGGGQASLSDRFALSIIKEVSEYGPMLLNELDNYELRAKMMYASTCALNGLTQFGKRGGDWGVHDFGHNLSLLYGVPHGASLSVVYPAWMQWMAKNKPQVMQKYTRELFASEDITEAIEGTRFIFSKLLCPVNLRELHLRSYNEEELLRSLLHNHVGGMVYPMNEDDYRFIIEKMSL